MVEEELILFLVFCLLKKTVYKNWEQEKEYRIICNKSDKLYYSLLSMLKYLYSKLLPHKYQVLLFQSLSIWSYWDIVKQLKYILYRDCFATQNSSSRMELYFFKHMVQLIE